MQADVEFQQLLRLLHLHQDDILALSEGLDALSAAGLLSTRLLPLRQRLSLLLQHEIERSPHPISPSALQASDSLGSIQPSSFATPTPHVSGNVYSLHSPSPSIFDGAGTSGLSVRSLPTTQLSPLAIPPEVSGDVYPSPLPPPSNGASYLGLSTHSLPTAQLSPLATPPHVSGDIYPSPLPSYSNGTGLSAHSLLATQVSPSAIPSRVSGDVYPLPSPPPSSGMGNLWLSACSLPTIQGSPLATPPCNSGDVHPSPSPSSSNGTGSLGLSTRSLPTNQLSPLAIPPQVSRDVNPSPSPSSSNGSGSLGLSTRSPPPTQLFPLPIPPRVSGNGYPLPLPSPSIQDTHSDHDGIEDGQQNRRGHVAGGGAGAPIPVGGQGECQRGARGLKMKTRKRKEWLVGKKPHVPVTETVESFITLLAAPHWGSETYDVEAWVSEVAGVLKDSQVVFQDESLGSVVGRCTNLGSLGLRVSFLTMLNQIQLVAKCTSLRLRKGLGNIKAIYDTELPLESRPSLQTFRGWHSSGSKFAALAAGGSIYTLILIAGLHLRTKLAALPGNMPWDIAQFLRAAPEGSPFRTLVKDRIVPTILKMQERLPLRMSSMFVRQILEEHLVTQEFACNDLIASDNFFDSLNFNQFALLSRDRALWGVNPNIHLTMPVVTSIHELTFRTLTPADFSSRPYSPLTDVDEVLLSRSVSPIQSLPDVEMAIDNHNFFD